MSEIERLQKFLKLQSTAARNITGLPCGGDQGLLSLADDFNQCAELLGNLEALGAENQMLRAKIKGSMPDIIASLDRMDALRQGMQSQINSKASDVVILFNALTEITETGNISPEITMAAKAIEMVKHHV